MHCLDCGNTWKELSALLPGPGNSTFSRPVAVAADASVDSEMRAGVADAVARDYRKDGKSGTLPMLLAVFILVLGVGATYLFLTRIQVQPAEKGLHVADLRFEELVRGNLGKVVRVKGVISNSGNQPELVKRLAIVLRKSNGSELTRWYYSSPVVKLAPGGKTRFVSSIQYDTPVIASVEALFE